MRALAMSLSSLALVLACSSEQASDQTSKPGVEAKVEVKAKPDAIPEAKPDAKPETKPETLPPKDGFFMAVGAPDPHACTVAKDCLGDTLPDLDNPCCQNPYTLQPHAWAYRNWMAKWRQEHCVDVSCPPPPPPALPPDCAFRVDCVGGVCVDSCPKPTPPP